MRIDEEHGLPARTRWRTIDRAGNRAAWVELQPLTGRTHQLRAHMAAIGHPVVGDEDEVLRGIFGEHQVPDRAVGERLRLDPELFDERAVFAKNLDAVVDAVAHVDEPVVAQPHAVHRIGELLG